MSLTSAADLALVTVPFTQSVGERASASEVVAADDNRRPWAPLGDREFTVLVGSRDPLYPYGFQVANADRPDPRQPTETESVSGERLALIVRKHSRKDFTREEQVRLMLLTEQLKGQVAGRDEGTSTALSNRFEEFETALRDLDQTLGFTRDDRR